MPHKLILNKGDEVQVQEYEDIGQAFIAAMPWIMKGYIARVTDQQGVVKYTQALANGQIFTYEGDATDQRSGPGPQAGTRQPASLPRKPWWRFW